MVFLLEVGDQLVRDGVAVWPEVGRIHGVRIVIIRVGVLDLDDDHAWIIGAGPFLVEAMGLILDDPVVAGQMEPIVVVGLQVFVGRLLAEPAKSPGENGRGR